MPDRDSHTTTPDPEMSDAEVIRLAEAEREAGVPDVQTAEASAEAKRRISEDGSTAEMEHADEPTDGEAAAQLADPS